MKQKITFFKVFLTLVLLCGVGNAWGESYKLTFKTGTNDGTDVSTSTACSDLVSQGAGYLSGNVVKATKVYYGGSGGLKLGTSSDAGTLKMNLSLAGQVTPTSIVVRAKRYSSGKATKLSLNGQTAQNLTSEFADYTFAITSEITYLELVSSKGTSGGAYAWIESITVNYTDKVLKSINVSGTPDKMTYTEGESFDPTGLVVTGTYEDSSEKPIVSGISWTVTPSSLNVETTSVSVVAKVNDIESSPYVVKNITVNEKKYADLYTSNVKLTTTGGTSASSAKVVIGGTQYDAIKAGTGSAAGKCVVSIPANTKTLHFHAVGWNGESVTVTVNGTAFGLTSYGAVSGTGTTYTITPTSADYYTINPNGATSVTFAATGGKRFVLFGVNAEAYKTQNVNISDAGYATAYIPFNSTVEGATAYYVTVDGDKAQLNEIKGTIRAETGVVLKGAKGTATFTESAVEPTTDVSANKMVGTLTTETFSDPDFVYYRLANNNGSVGFYKQNADGSAECAAGKAVLAVPASAVAPTSFTFDDATAINAISNVKTSSVRYNLNGQAVGEDYKGIVIVNGKKMFNK